MAVPDPRYSCFSETTSGHAFQWGLLTEFADADLLSLVCPRPILVQYGKADSIGWWPAVAEEFERARTHWDALGLGDRVALDLHEGGHELVIDSGTAWLDRWL